MWERVSRAGEATERAADAAAGTHATREPAEIPPGFDVDAVVAPVVNSPGKPLPGFDFSRVRIHTDDRAGESARLLDAAAYTAGDHIVFAPGQMSRALLEHELVHVAQGVPGVVHRSGPLGFLSDIFTEGPGEALSRLFGEGEFTPQQLTAYLDKLRDQQRIEGDYDSDNKARAVTRLWVQGDRHVQLGPQLKTLLVREMWEGTTSEADAKAILDILERSLDPDLLAIFTIGGVPPKHLHDSFGKAERQRLSALLDQRLKGGSAGALKGEAMEFAGGPSAPTNLNDETFRRRWEKALAGAVDRMRRAMVTDPATCSFPTQDVFKFDQEQWTQQPFVRQGGMTVRDTGGKGTFEPKAGTPSAAVQSLLDHMTGWECDCLFATQIAQLFAWKEVLTPEAFDKKFAGFRTGAGQGSATTGLDAETVSVVGEVTTEGLAQSLRTSPVGTIVVWNNTSRFALGTAFEFEHVIKAVHKGSGEDDRYAAHGFEGATFGDPLTAEQIRWHLAEVNPDFPFRFTIDAQTITDLTADNVAPYLISQLEQHLLFEAITWLEFRKLKPISELMAMTNPEAVEQLHKIKKWTRRPPPDTKAARAYVDKTIVLDRVEIPK